MFQLCEKIFVRSVVLLVLAFISLSSYAVISVLPIMKQIKFTDPKFFDFKVINLSKDEPAYVEVTAYKATNVSSGAIKWVAMKHNPRQFGFVVTPTKLIVPAQQTRPVRVLTLLKNYKKDVLLKINFNPATNPLIVVKHKEPSNKAINQGLQLVFAFNAIVILRPAHPHADIVLKRQNKKLTILNEGNSYALVRRLKICGKQDNCAKFLPKNKVYRIYAGQSVTVNLPRSYPVQLQKFFMGKTSDLKST